MKKLLFGLMAIFLFHHAVPAYILDEEIFGHRPTDPLAPRDQWGLLHQMPYLNALDLAPRYTVRAGYYFNANEQLVRQPAYVAALQRDLGRLGYYCGPINGFYSFAVTDAIARLQKNYSMQVTGTLTDGVRRALRLP
ncbi:MAG: peptidoglycan-binding domain-containing protein [Verrucomicrobiota bacterium]